MTADLATFVDKLATRLGVRLCATDGCDRPFYGRNLCALHYRRARKAGMATVRRISTGARTGPKPRPDEERLWEKIDKRGVGECWPWQAAKLSRTGYGLFVFRGKQTTAHRAVLILVTGEDHPGEDACHSCDNPPSCNPGHLFWGSRIENMADMLAKGRHWSQSGSYRPGVRA